MRKNALVILPLVFFLGVGTWIARAQQPAAPSKLEKIKDDLYVITGDGGNTTVYLTNAGVILVDAKFERGCLLGNFSAELSNQSAAIREALRKVYGRWTADIAVAIADAQADGTIASKTPAGELAAYLLDAYEGALLRSRVERSREAFDRFVEFAFTRILV